MAGYFAVGTLAAFGLLSALWAVLGWLLPGCGGWALVCWGVPEAEDVSRFRWLHSLGLLSVPLLVVAEETDTAPPGTEICSREELLPRLEWERKRFDGTGNGDHTGRHQRRGVSEL